MTALIRLLLVHWIRVQIFLALHSNIMYFGMDPLAVLSRAHTASIGLHPRALNARSSIFVAGRLDLIYIVSLKHAVDV